MSTHRIADFTTLEPGDLATVTVDGRAIAVTVEDGQAYVCDDACTHAQCSLSGGEGEDDAVICPCHFAAFDIATGAVRPGPAQTALRCYRAQLADGALTAEVPERPRPAPSVSSSSAPASPVPLRRSPCATPASTAMSSSSAWRPSFPTSALPSASPTSQVTWTSTSCLSAPPTPTTRTASRCDSARWPLASMPTVSFDLVVRGDLSQPDAPLVAIFLRAGTLTAVLTVNSGKDLGRAQRLIGHPVDPAALADTGVDLRHVPALAATIR